MAALALSASPIPGRTILPLATLLWSAGSASAARTRLALGHGTLPMPAVSQCRRRRSSGDATMRGGGKRRGEVPVKPKKDEPVEVTNFIRNIIKDDLSSGKHASIVTRFPPEPNGYLHIGHAKSICVNFGLGQEFEGTTYMRLDDTNPEKEEQEYVDSILSDVKWCAPAILLPPAAATCCCRRCCRRCRRCRHR